MRIAVLTISDSCAKGERTDESGPAIKELMKKRGADIIAYDIVSDTIASIKEKLIYYSDELRVDLALTTGGTGLSPYDVTPEATKEVIEKDVPGIPELIRLEGIKKTRHAALSRSIAGIRAATLIVNLPGSVKGARESLEAILDILPHSFDMLAGKGHGGKNGG